MTDLIRKKIVLSAIHLIFVLSLNAQYISIESEVTMLALGDSYTIGTSVETNDRWPHQFIDALRKEGVQADYPDYIATTGWTTGNLLRSIYALFDSTERYNLVSILIGVNNQYQGLPILNYEPDLKKIIEFALETVEGDSTKVFVLSIPDYAYTAFGKGNELISEEIDLYNSIKEKTALSYGVQFINITPISRAGLENPSLVASDGLHPSALQYRQWVDQVLSRVQFDPSVDNQEAEKASRHRVRVYPNPFTSLVVIDAPLDVHKVRVFNVLGLQVLEQSFSSSPLRLDFTGLSSGQYTLVLWDANENIYSRHLLIYEEGH